MCLRAWGLLASSIMVPASHGVPACTKGGAKHEPFVIGQEKMRGVTPLLTLTPPILCALVRPVPAIAMPMQRLKQQLQRLRTWPVSRIDAGASCCPIVQMHRVFILPSTPYHCHIHPPCFPPLRVAY